MSRTYKPTRQSWRPNGGGHRHRANRGGWQRRLFNKAERRAVHEALHGELRDASDERLEVLADLYEEQGRLALAEQLRRGNDSVLPQKPAQRVWRR